MYIILFMFQSYKRLHTTLEKYMETVKRVSDGMIEMKMMSKRS